MTEPESVEPEPKPEPYVYAEPGSLYDLTGLAYNRESYFR